MNSKELDNLLIEAVYRRDPLWNSNHEHHKNSNILKKLWEEIAEEVQKDVKTARTRWRNLRAYYIKECHRLEKAKGNRSKCLSTWQYFDKLRFISNWSIPNGPMIDGEESYNSMGDECNPIDFLESPSPAPSSLSDSGASPNKNKLDQTDSYADDNITEFKRRKLEMLQKEASRKSNDDLLFFESLLPYLKEVPSVRKLQLRSKIHELILDELESIQKIDT